MGSHTLLDRVFPPMMDVTGVVARPPEYPAQNRTVFHVCKHLKKYNFLWNRQHI